MHTGPRFAELPPPPYYAVIFSSQRSPRDEAGYAATAARREGHRTWYEHIELRIARVERAYGGIRREQA